MPSERARMVKVTSRAREPERIEEKDEAGHEDKWQSLSKAIRTGVSFGIGL